MSYSDPASTILAHDDVVRHLLPRGTSPSREPLQGFDQLGAGSACSAPFRAALEYRLVRVFTRICRARIIFNSVIWSTGRPGNISLPHPGRPARLRLALCSRCRLLHHGDGFLERPLINVLLDPLGRSFRSWSAGQPIDDLLHVFSDHLLGRLGQGDGRAFLVHEVRAQIGFDDDQRFVAARAGPIRFRRRGRASASGTLSRRMVPSQTSICMPSILRNRPSSWARARSTCSSRNWRRIFSRRFLGVFNSFRATSCSLAAWARLACFETSLGGRRPLLGGLDSFAARAFLCRGRAPGLDSPPPVLALLPCHRLCLPPCLLLYLRLYPHLYPHLCPHLCPHPCLDPSPWLPLPSPPCPFPPCPAPLALVGFCLAAPAPVSRPLADLSLVGLGRSCLAPPAPFPFWPCWP